MPVSRRKTDAWPDMSRTSARSQRPSFRHSANTELRSKRKGCVDEANRRQMEGSSHEITRTGHADQQQRADRVVREAAGRQKKQAQHCHSHSRTTLTHPPRIPSESLVKKPKAKGRVSDPWGDLSEMGFPFSG